VLRESDYPLPEAFNTAFNESEIIIFESSADDPTDLLNNEEIKSLLVESEWISTMINENDKIIMLMDLANRYSAIIAQNEDLLNGIYDPVIGLTDEEQKIVDQISAISSEYQAMSEDEDIKAFFERSQKIDAKMKENEDIKYFFESFFNPDFESLETVLNRETFGLLESICKKHNYSITDLKYLKPYLAYSCLSMHILRQFAQADGVDDFFMKKAKEYNKSIEYFENAEFQYNLLANLGNEYGDDYYAYLFHDLDSDLDSDEEIEMAFNQMVNSWKSGVENNTFMLSMSYEMENFPTVYEAMIANRNNTWMPIIESYLKTSPIEFVLVGNGHMYGPDGLLTQLKKGDTI
jgi:uncharacterized protein YbaP (TraB family)